LATLRALGVGFAQGYYLGRPAPIGQLLATEQSTKSSGLKARGPR
jgi:EAL domain-containing protein (putative c-di-GMP-specific phosphodiesterase class I)